MICRCDCIVDKPELRTLLKELLEVAYKWENIGVLLGIEPNILQSVKSAVRDEPTNCLREMLIIWVKQICPPPSWSAIVDVLEDLKEEKLAFDLRSKYL